MGFVAMCAGLIAAFVALVPGVIAVIVHKRGRDQGHGSWPIFIGITVVGILVCLGVAIGLMKAFEGGSGSPSGDQYTALLLSFAICAAGPGFGLSLGALALLKRGAETQIPPRG